MVRNLIASLFILLIAANYQRTSAQSINFGAAPAQIVQGPNIGDISFWGTANYQFGANPQYQGYVFNVNGGVVYDFPIAPIKAKNSPPGTTSVTFGTQDTPLSTGTTFTPGNTYWIILEMTVIQNSDNFTSSKWYQVTINQGNGTSPGTANATIVVNPNLQNNSGEILASATVTLLNGWQIAPNNIDYLYSVAQPGNNPGPGYGVGIQANNNLPLAPTFDDQDQPENWYALYCGLQITNGPGFFQGVASPVILGYDAN